MKRFRFPLRPVAVLRAHRELRAREAFAAAVHVYVQAEERLAATRARAAELAAALFAGRGGTFLAADAASAFRSYRAECEEVVQDERAMIEAKAVMNKKRDEYLEANRQLKVVERLEEKARANHRFETNRAEQAVLDEFAGYRSTTRRPVFS
ncbi:MAG: flagellar export protein FliJ [Opitutus sp.]|nr:flagellar export protein FliJ [Opitutus sp.]